MRPEDVYESTLRAMVSLIESSYGPDAAGEFGEALRAWEERRDVTAFLGRVTAGAGMGSYWDGRPTTRVPWACAAYDGLRSALAATVQEVAAGYEHPVEWVPPPGRWLLGAQKCSECGLVSTVEHRAQGLWEHFVVIPAASVGRAGEIVAQARAGSDDPACREWVDAVDAAFARLGVATHADGDTCPRCGAADLRVQLLWLTAPPVEVEEVETGAPERRPPRRPGGDDAIVREIEDAFVAHWSLLGQWPGARLVDDRGALRFETPVRKLPYNGVIRTAIFERAEEVVPSIVDAYRRRGVELMWVVHPSAVPRDVDDDLEAAGLAQVERAVGMSLDLDGWNARSEPVAAELAEVLDEDGLRAYVDVSMDYWELDEADRELVTALNRHWSGTRARGRRWLALLEGRAVGKGYLSLAGPPGIGAIYGMSVDAEVRGRGIAGALTDALLRQAQGLGCRRVVLHSSEMAVGLYRRAGFVERCELRFYASAPIWSRKH